MYCTNQTKTTTPKIPPTLRISSCASSNSIVPSLYSRSPHPNTFPFPTMVYGSATEEERMLSYSPKEIMNPVPSNTSTTSKPTAPNPPYTNQAPADQTPQPSNSDDILSSTTASRAVSYAKKTWHECRPWTEFYSTKALSRPQFAALSDRFATNLHTYRANYQVITAFWLLFFLLGTIHTLLLAGILFFCLEKWCSRVASRNGNTLQQKHKVFAIVAALVIIWVTGIGKYTVISLFFTAISIAVHAAFHEPDYIETEIV